MGAHMQGDLQSCIHVCIMNCNIRQRRVYRETGQEQGDLEGIEKKILCNTRSYSAKSTVFFLSFHTLNFRIAHTHVFRSDSDEYTKYERNNLHIRLA